MTALATAPLSLEGRLAAKAAAGDPLAFRRLYDRHVGSVRRFARAILRDAPAADEATQETFVRAHAGLGKLAEPERLVPWLLTITRHVAFEELRRRGAWRDGEDALEEAPSPAPSPEAALLGAEADAAYQRALDELAAPRRAALLLAIDHGLAYAEIADAMAWSLAKTKIEIHRARAALRARLGEHLRGRA